MAKDRLSLSGDFLNFLKFSVTESAAATFTEKEIDTNLSAERGVLMEIHSIDLIFPNIILMATEIAANANEVTQFHISRESKTAFIKFDDADCIASIARQMGRSAAIGTDAGPLYQFFENCVRIDFPMPLPYVKPSIFMGLLASAASATSVQGRIGYTLRDISRQEFLELLVALQ